MSPWLKRYPNHFFVATKTGERRAVQAREELQRSLDRLKTRRGPRRPLAVPGPNLSDPIQWDTALSPGGVIEAAIEARQQGLVRAIGITGHGTQVAATHRRSLSRFDFDSVLLPYNFLTMQIPYYAEHFNAVLATCQERGAAVQTIKLLRHRTGQGMFGRGRVSS